MKNWKTFVVTFVIVFSTTLIRNILNSRNENKFTEVVVNDSYSMLLPDYLKKTDILNNEASLQYMDTAKRVYLMVIEELKDNTIFEHNEYFNAVLRRFKEQLIHVDRYEKGEIQLNGLNSKVAYLEGKKIGGMIFSKIVVVESQDYFYQIITWTALKNNMYFENDIEKSISTFKVL